jgi:hypothetical protein
MSKFSRIIRRMTKYLRKAVSSPYSYNCKRIPKDAEDQVEAAMGAAKAIKDVHGTAYTVREFNLVFSLQLHDQ